MLNILLCKNQVARFGRHPWNCSLVFKYNGFVPFCLMSTHTSWDWGVRMKPELQPNLKITKKKTKTTEIQLSPQNSILLCLKLGRRLEKLQIGPNLLEVGKSITLEAYTLPWLFLCKLEPNISQLDHTAPEYPVRLQDGNSCSPSLFSVRLLWTPSSQNQKTRISVSTWILPLIFYTAIVFNWGNEVKELSHPSARFTLSKTCQCVVMPGANICIGGLAPLKIVLFAFLLTTLPAAMFLN